MKHLTISGVFALVFVTLAFAHGGVENHAVMMRMEAMKISKGAFKRLGDMAKGKTAFDPSRAVIQQAKLVEHLGQVPDLFRNPEGDPKSEALPVIWENWADFEDKATVAEQAAREMDVTTLESLKAGVMNISATCHDCHQVYRLKKK